MFKKKREEDWEKIDFDQQEEEEPAPPRPKKAPKKNAREYEGLDIPELLAIQSYHATRIQMINQLLFQEAQE